MCNELGALFRAKIGIGGVRIRMFLFAINKYHVRK